MNTMRMHDIQIWPLPKVPFSHKIMEFIKKISRKKNLMEYTEREREHQKYTEISIKIFSSRLKVTQFGNCNQCL